MLNRIRIRGKFVWTRIVRRGGAALVVLAVVGASRPASAQIFSWRDANGNLVLSNRKPGSVIGSTTPRTFPVAETSSVRTTRFADTLRTRLYDDLLAENSRLNGVRLDLVRAVVQVESAFNAYARSPRGALGLMQLMPATIQEYGVRNPFDPVQNIRAGVAYLRQLLDRYDNNEELALAAYNAGPRAVDRHGQTIPPYRETRNYVSRVHQVAGRTIPLRESRIYKSTQVIDGQEIPLYSDHKPANGGYEVVNR